MTGPAALDYILDMWSSAISAMDCLLRQLVAADDPCTLHRVPGKPDPLVADDVLNRLLRDFLPRGTLGTVGRESRWWFS